MFSALEKDDLARVIDAMQEKKINEKDVVVISQGDEVQENDHGLYIIETGQLLVYKRTPDAPEGRGKRVWQYTNPGDGFGELALLYNCPRAATVVTDGPCRLWALDRAAFNGLVKDACIRKRMQYQAFLEKVELFTKANLEVYEIAKLSDVLRTQNMKRGDVICKQGDQGDMFYLLVEGECEASVNGKVVKEYRDKGDYFGELALKSGSDGVRKATVSCTADGSLATMDRHSFKRLLGSVESIMGARSDEYNAALNK
jgi:cAMP-dependent protein kinase regulator